MASVEHSRSRGAAFQRRFETRSSTLYFTTKKDGSGIGLAMTYRIVELHNGSIEVQTDASTRNDLYFALPPEQFSGESERVDTLCRMGEALRNQLSPGSPEDEGFQVISVHGAFGFL